MSIYAGCGHNYYGNSCGKCAMEAGAEQERAKIVAWMLTYGMLRNLADVADAIKAKEHLK
jgi:hypothetical protein